MLQCFLTDVEGVLSLGKPRRKPSPSSRPLDNDKWTASALDNICVEELVDLMAAKTPLGPADVPKAQHVRRGLLGPTRQYHFVKQDGVLLLQRPMHQRHLRPRLEGTDTSACASTRIKVSILALPPELRMPIYRHLLVSEVDYDCPVICPNTDGFRIVTGATKSQPRGLSPEILATCRLINQEGTPVLYGENMFSREFYWPRRWHLSRNRSRQVQWPLSESSKLRFARGLQYISRLSISQQQHQWLLGDGELKVFRDFPSAARKQPRLRKIQCQFWLAKDHNYGTWIARCRGRRLDFSLHDAKKKQFERYMAEENLFGDRSTIWSFVTNVHEDSGPSCSLELLIAECHGVPGDDAARTPVVVCRTIGGYALDHDAETTSSQPDT
ncbi:unnamed protein product [Clonostachys solani]|uniref:Uncharacterized protein n=1 Tax=Clonostachys solani TaxID=160281 RepID=A0A9N9ZHB5_9HYPO|nr:unnamed protein product [Clonostachys solani]